jgi:iron complex outermembrane receptor protein
MIKFKFLLSFIVLALLSLQVVAQQQTIKGKITDAAGAAVSGATVKVKSTGSSVVTDKDGGFTVEAKPDDVLETSFVGLKSQNFKVKGQTDIVIKMEASVSSLGEVVVTGSRAGARVKTESPVPVDVIHVNDAAQVTAKPDLMSQLNMSVPSFNYNKQSGGDGSDAIDFASLRGLGFDQTLVLVNGKRRHLSAFVNQVGTRGRGNSGTDLNAIPEASIDRIEILRDGASAQYGSDAIAGVVNIILKKDINHLNFNIGGGGFYDHKYNSLNAVDPTQFYTGSQVDGKTFTAAANYGLAIGKSGGFINIGANYMNQGKTFRQVPDTNWTTNSKALSTNDWRRAAGDGSVVSGGSMFNLEIPLKGTSTTFYSFGGYNYKHSNVYAWTRRWHRENNQVKFPTDEAGNLIFVPSIMRVFGTSDGTIGPNNVYYNPQEDVYIKDGSFAMGFKGTTGSGWDWDASNVTGKNDFHYFGNKTFNASLIGPDQVYKNRFDDGGFSFLQNTTNLDVNKHFSTVAEGLTVALGGEFRYEKYKLYAGEPDSYRAGGAFYVRDGDTSYKASGSEGYPGYQPGDEANAHRTNVGGYVDLTLDVTKKFLLDGAARFENYSDFGFVNTYKLASRYKLASNFNIRGSISTGFRAPSLQQINFSNTNTNIIGGNLVYAKLIPNYSPVARSVGIPKLKQEQSTNASLGFSWKPVRNLTVTVDGYWVKMKNRIVITGSFDETVAALKNYLVTNNVSNANFFVNAVNTTNTGIDVVVDYTKKFGNKRFSALLAGNIQHVSIDKVNVPAPLNDTYAHQQSFFSTREATFLKSSAPLGKFSFALEYSVNKFAIGSHLTYFGKVVEQGFGYASVPGAPAGGPGGAGISDNGTGWDPYVTTDDGKSVVKEDFIFHGKITTDVYVSYKLSKTCTWSSGIDNIFNVHPDLAITPGAAQSSWGDSESGGAFDAVQMGSNGLRMFTKLAFHF